MDISLIFKIAAVGILIAVIDKVLKSFGKEDIATVTTLGGLVIVMMMVLGLITRLFDSIKTMFQF